MRANGLGFRERCPALFAALVLKRARTKVALVLSLGCLAKIEVASKGVEKEQAVDSLPVG